MAHLLDTEVEAVFNVNTGAVVNFKARAIDAVDGEVPVTYSKAPGSVFPPGDTTVAVTSVDQAGNSAKASFKVKVQDTTPPTFASMDDIEVDATGPDGAAVNFAATAIDLVDGPVAVSYSRAPGLVFPVGTTKVTCMAEDSSGNAAIKTFKVTVKGQAVGNPGISRDGCAWRHKINADSVPAELHGGSGQSRSGR